MTRRALWTSYGVEALAIVGALACAAYYTWHAGWKGIVYSILAGAFGYIAVAWMGRSMPVIGYFLDKWDRERAERDREREP